MRLYLHPKLKERCRSGRTGQSRKLLNSLWVPGVRIPLSPQKMKREKSCRVHSNNFFPSSSSAKPAAGGRGCATIGSKSPGESVIPSHPHVDVRPSGANPPERASSRHIRTWMCDHREQIPRREHCSATSARECATPGSKLLQKESPKSLFSLLLRKEWYHRTASADAVEPFIAKMPSQLLPKESPKAPFPLLLRKEWYHRTVSADAVEPFIAKMPSQPLLKESPKAPFPLLLRKE